MDHRERAHGFINPTISRIIYYIKHPCGSAWLIWDFAWMFEYARPKQVQIQQDWNP